MASITQILAHDYAMLIHTYQPSLNPMVMLITCGHPPTKLLSIGDFVSLCLPQIDFYPIIPAQLGDMCSVNPEYIVFQLLHMHADIRYLAIPHDWVEIQTINY